MNVSERGNAPEDHFGWQVEEWKPSLAISITWNVLGIGMVFVGFLLFTVIYALIGAGSLGASSPIEASTEGDTTTVAFQLEGALLLIVLVVLVLVVHEAIHGLVFRIFGGRPQYGAAMIQKVLPVLYCSAPGYFFTRNEFSWVVLAPLIVISLAGIALMPVVENGLLIIIPLALNFGGAIGDVWMFGMLLRRRDDVMIEDLKDGLRFHYPQPVSG